MGKERRKHPRLRILLEAEYLVAGEKEWRQGTIWSLSAGGAALLCEEKLERGTVLEGLRFVVEAEGELPEIRIEVGAEVVKLDRKDDFGRPSNFMLDLRFEGLEEQESELLRQFVFQRLTRSRPSAPGVEVESEEKTGVPVIEVRFKLLDEFVEEVSENLSLSGMFIRANKPLPPGSVFAFQYQLGDDFSLLQGTAEVIWRRRRSEGSKQPPGMGVRFTKLDLTSQKLVKRLVDQRRRADAQEAAAAAGEPSPAVATDAAETAASEAKLSPRLKPLEKQLAKANAARDKAQDRCGRLRAEAESLRDEAERARSRAEAELSELRRELEARAPDGELKEELQRSREELERRQEEWEKREAELRAELERRSAGEVELQERVDLAGEAEGELRQRLEQVERSRHELEQRLEQSAEVEAADVRDRLAALERTRLGVEEERDKLQRRAVETEAGSRLEDGLAEATFEAIETGDPPLESPTESMPEVAVEAASDLEPGEPEFQEEVAELPSETLRPAPTRGARLVDLARRAIARLGFAKRVAADSNGGDAESDTAPPTEDEAAAASAALADVAGAVTIEETVRAWAAAWSEQRVEDYVSFYSREFEPAQAGGDDDSGAAPHAWLPPLNGMELTLGPITQTEVAPGRVAVHFEQSVETDSYTRRTGRTLEMVREADAWKIAAESFQDLTG